MLDTVVASAIDWVIGASLRGESEGALLEGVCERMTAGGLPLTRVAIGSLLLHPTLNSRGYRWLRGEGVFREDYAHDTATPEVWEKSPFRALVESNARTMRRRLDGDYRMGEFEILDNLKTGGSTDYYSTLHGGDRPGKLGDAISSWAMDRPGGYTDDEIAQIERVASAFALAYRNRNLHGTIRTLMETYLGSGAAARVLDGNIRRGQAEPIEAVIWYSDLANFTRIADEIERDQLLSLLNEYAATLVDAIEDGGGEVLKFVGDGILAIFADDDHGRAAARALQAARRAEAEIVALNAARAASGLRVSDFYLALHVGTLLFGNFGSRSRLDFTVLGPAVNEASRIAGMCRSLDQRVVVSSGFAAAAGPRRRDLVSLGRYALRGIGQPQELFTLDRPSA